MLGAKLNMAPEEAERWIVNLIRNANLDAKIDSQQGTVVMGSQILSPYQTVIEKTKNLFNRTQSLVNTSERKKDTNVRIQRNSLQIRFLHCRRIGIIIKPNHPKPLVEWWRLMSNFNEYFIIAPVVFNSIRSSIKISRKYRKIFLLIISKFDFL